MPLIHREVLDGYNRRRPQSEKISKCGRASGGIENRRPGGSAVWKWDTRRVRIGAQCRKVETQRGAYTIRKGLSRCLDRIQRQ